MPLIKLESIDLAFGNHIIFDRATLQLDKGDRVGLIGRNGEGKSTLLKTIIGTQEVDGGTVYRHPDLKIAYVPQELPPASTEKVADYVAGGAASILEDLAAYDALSANASEADLNKLTHLQQRIDTADGWTFSHRLNRILVNFGLDQGQLLSDLSGGWRRKAAIARALVTDPDMLLLDEPTNHLDVGLIQWLEGFINSFSGAVIIITHDRAFLRAVSNSIAELDRGHLTRWKGNYTDFLVFKQQQLDAEEKQNALFDKRLAEEEAWIREGIKARRTRNEGRVRALKKMRDERSKRRETASLGRLDIAAGGSSGKLVAEIESINFAFDGKMVVRDFSGLIMRGDKIGLIGPNGAGKSTLLKLVLGELEPQSGTLSRGTNLSVAYFDQMRDQIDMEANIVDNIGQGRQSIDINGKEKHILSYLQDFMFSPARARTPVKALSGGEKSRVMLAKLFCKESNLLVMDEPTNDLDTETLELLEMLLVNYEGTVLLVSHDREFLDNVVSSSLIFEGQGKISEYVGGYQDWIRQGGDWQTIVNQQTASPLDNNQKQVEAAAVVKKAKKLSYKDQREFDAIPDKIHKCEQKVEMLTNEMAASGFYEQDTKLVQIKLDELSLLEKELQALFDRWEALEDMMSE